MPRPEAMTPDEVRAGIDWVLKAGEIILSRHCKRDRMPDRNVSLRDILRCLREGDVTASAGWHETHENWRYRVVGLDLDGDPLTVVITFEARALIVVVTVF